MLPRLHRCRHSLLSWCSSADCCDPSKTFGVWLTQAVNSNKDAAVSTPTNQNGSDLAYLSLVLDRRRVPVTAVAVGSIVGFGPWPGGSFGPGRGRHSFGARSMISGPAV